MLSLQWDRAKLPWVSTTLGINLGSNPGLQALSPLQATLGPVTSLSPFLHHAQCAPLCTCCSLLRTPFPQVFAMQVSASVWLKTHTPELIIWAQMNPSGVSLG